MSRAIQILIHSVKHPTGIQTSIILDLLLLLLVLEKEKKNRKKKTDLIKCRRKVQTKVCFQKSLALSREKKGFSYSCVQYTMLIIIVQINANNGVFPLEQQPLEWRPSE